MSRYSIERREWVLRQMMPPGNRPVSELAEETGISTVTLYAWRKVGGAAGAGEPGDGKSSAGSSTDKFRVVLESAALSETELGEYCRRKGLYVEQIRGWREACAQANATAQKAGDRTRNLNYALHL